MDGRTDGRTDRQTDILPRHSARYTYVSRGKKIESLQRRFTKRIPRCDKLNYCGRLAEFRIDSLEMLLQLS